MQNDIDQIKIVERREGGIARLNVAQIYLSERRCVSCDGISLDPAGDQSGKSFVRLQAEPLSRQ